MCKPSLGINAVAGSASEALLVGLGAIPGAWLRLKVVNHFQPMVPKKHWGTFLVLSLIHISEPTRLALISYAVFCLKKKKN